MNAAFLPSTVRGHWELQKMTNWSISVETWKRSKILRGVETAVIQSASDTPPGNPKPSAKAQVTLMLEGLRWRQPESGQRTLQLWSARLSIRQKYPLNSKIVKNALWFMIHMEWQWRLLINRFNSDFLPTASDSKAFLWGKVTTWCTARPLDLPLPPALQGGGRSPPEGDLLSNQVS